MCLGSAGLVLTPQEIGQGHRKNPFLHTIVAAQSFEFLIPRDWQAQHILSDLLGVIPVTRSQGCCHVMGAGKHLLDTQVM